jgi:hypothetical protein
MENPILLPLQATPNFSPSTSNTITLAFSALANQIHRDLCYVLTWRAYHPQLAPVHFPIRRLGPKAIFVNKSTQAFDLVWQRGYNDRWQINIEVPEGASGDLILLGQEEWREVFVGRIMQVFGSVAKATISGEEATKRFDFGGVVVDVKVQYDLVWDGKYPVA